MRFDFRLRLQKQRCRSLPCFLFFLFLANCGRIGFDHLSPAAQDASLVSDVYAESSDENASDGLADTLATIEAGTDASVDGDASETDAGSDVQSGPIVCGDMSGLQPGAAWPMKGYCPTHAGRSPYLGAQTPKVKWTYSLGTAKMSTPVTIGADGTVYFGGNDHKLHAVRPDGTLKWQYGVAGNINVPGSAIDVAGTLYIGSSGSSFYAIQSDGTLKWSVGMPNEMNNSAVIGGDRTVYVNAINGMSLYAFVPDGGVKWQSPLTTSNSSAAIGLDGTIYVSDQTGLKAISTDGKLKWTYPAPGAFTPTIAPDGSIYFPAGATLYAVDPSGGPLWSFLGDANLNEASIGDDGTIYFGSNTGTLYAITKTGKVQWTYKANGIIWCQPAIAADGTIYFGDSGGTAYAVKKDGSTLWTLAVNGGFIHNDPAIAADGTLYFGAGATVYAVGP